MAWCPSAFPCKRETQKHVFHVPTNSALSFGSLSCRVLWVDSSRMSAASPIMRMSSSMTGLYADEGNSKKGYETK